MSHLGVPCHQVLWLVDDVGLERTWVLCSVRNIVQGVSELLENDEPEGENDWVQEKEKGWVCSCVLE
jgi:hypothetical protein